MAISSSDTNNADSSGRAGGTIHDRVDNNHLMAAVFTQAWENVRHICNERIWFGNI